MNLPTFQQNPNMKKLAILFTFILTAGFAQAQKAEVKMLNTFMDDWHKAAAEANSEGFYGKMAEESIYIGTDAMERWLRDELKAWAQKAFERDVAWDFNPIERNWHFLGNDIAIGDEKLETWMGICRATIVLKKLDGQWLIHHYHLAVTVPNEQIADFKKLLYPEN